MMSAGIISDEITTDMFTKDRATMNGPALVVLDDGKERVELSLTEHDSITVDYNKMHISIVSYDESGNQFIARAEYRTERIEITRPVVIK